MFTAALDAALPEWTCRSLEETMRECAKPHARDGTLVLDAAARAPRPCASSADAAESTSENATHARVKTLATGHVPMERQELDSQQFEFRPFA